MLNPSYDDVLTDVRKMHEIETFDIRIIINEMMPKFYDYIVVAELVENPYIATPSVTTANRSLYFNENTVGGPITDSSGCNILRERVG